MKNGIYLLLSYLLLMTSCTKDRLTASGIQQVEERTLQPFTGIHLSGAYQMKVIQGDTYRVRITGSGNLISYFKTSVSHQQLTLSYEKASINGDDLVVEVTTPRWNVLKVNGRAEVIVSGDFPDQEEVRIHLNGAASIDFKNGFSTDRLHVDLSGAGRMKASSILAREAEVQLSGSGETAVYVLRSLKARISGSGKIYYGGSPEVNSTISGSGSVIRL